MNYVPTKEELIEDYFNSRMTHQEIAEKYGYKTRQVVNRWFKKYQLKSKSKSELSREKFLKENSLPTKEELVELYKNNSISQISKIIGISRKSVSNLMDEYGVSTTYYKYKLDDFILIEELNNLSLKEIQIKYFFPIEELKRRKLNKINIPKIHYSNDRLKEIFDLYDIHNQGFSKQILNDDVNVYNSILENTKNHSLQSNKITERIYRILNKFNENDVCLCSKCNNVLKFYTMKMGYGNSDYKLCDKCIIGQCSSSKPSQELFWNLYNKMNLKNNCYFSELNLEKTIFISNRDRKKLNNHPKLNKTRYSIDFMYEDKIIEFDGRYWHSDEEKEIIKDKFLRLKKYKVLHIFDDEYKINPQETLNKCIEFLSK